MKKKSEKGLLSIVMLSIWQLCNMFSLKIFKDFMHINLWVNTIETWLMPMKRKRTWKNWRNRYNMNKKWQDWIRREIYLGILWEMMKITFLWMILKLFQIVNLYLVVNNNLTMQQFLGLPPHSILKLKKVKNLWRYKTRDNNNFNNLHYSLTDPWQRFLKSLRKKKIKKMKWSPRTWLSVRSCIF